MGPVGRHGSGAYCEADMTYVRRRLQCASSHQECRQPALDEGCQHCNGSSTHEEFGANPMHSVERHSPGIRDVCFQLVFRNERWSQSSAPISGKENVMHTSTKLELHIGTQRVPTRSWKVRWLRMAVVVLLMVAFCRFAPSALASDNDKPTGRIEGPYLS